MPSACVFRRAKELQPLGPHAVQRGAIKHIGISDDGREWTAVTVDGLARTWLAPSPVLGTADAIIRRLRVDTGFQIDDNQVCVALIARIPRYW